MTTEQNGSSDNEELQRINNELLKRREIAKAEAMKKYEDKLSEIKVLLTQDDYDSARKLAENLRDTLVFRDVIKAFQEKPAEFCCNNCGRSVDVLAFKENTLTWIRPHLCESCDQSEMENEIDRQKRAYENFVDRKMKDILKSVGVEGLLLNASYDNFPLSIVQACNRSALGKHGLYIWGGVGRGKTWLSVAVLRNLIKTPIIPKEKTIPVTRDANKFRDFYRFVYVPWLLTEIKSSYDDNSSYTEQSIIDLYTNIPVLVLDDIGSERPTEWVREKLNMIIYYRNLRGLKTIYTSNIAPDELRERLDERITSRIMQQCEIIHLSGPDRRRQ